MIVKFVERSINGKKELRHPITALPIDFYKNNKQEAKEVSKIDVNNNYSHLGKVHEIEIE